jgi:hypothetical protein
MSLLESAQTRHYVSAMICIENTTAERPAARRRAVHVLKSPL